LQAVKTLGFLLVQKCVLGVKSVEWFTTLLKFLRVSAYADQNRQSRLAASGIRPKAII